MDLFLVPTEFRHCTTLKIQTGSGDVLDHSDEDIPSYKEVFLRMVVASPDHTSQTVVVNDLDSRRVASLTASEIHVALSNDGMNNLSFPILNLREASGRNDDGGVGNDASAAALEYPPFGRLELSLLPPSVLSSLWCISGGGVDGGVDGGADDSSRHTARYEIALHLHDDDHDKNAQQKKKKKQQRTVIAKCRRNARTQSVQMEFLPSGEAYAPLKFHSFLLMMHRIYVVGSVKAANRINLQEVEESAMR